MGKKRKKVKKWWQHLLVIPVILIIDVLALSAAAIADASFVGDGLGHSAPAFILAAVIVCGVLTVVLTLRALVLCLRASIHTHRGSGM